MAAALTEAGWEAEDDSESDASASDDDVSIREYSGEDDHLIGSHAVDSPGSFISPSKLKKRKGDLLTPSVSHKRPRAV